MHKFLRWAGVVCTLALISLSARAESVVDDASKVVYEIIEGTQTAMVSNTQSLSSYSGVLTIPATVTDTNPESANYGNEYTVVGIWENAFRYTPITGVIIEAQVPEIPANAFYSCSSLASVSLPESVKTIGASAFRSCTKLEEITLGPELESIGESAFYGCSSLKKADTSASTKLRTIANYAFYNCPNLVCPAFPASLSLLGQYSFSYCKNLGSVTFPTDIQIEAYAFSYSCISALNFPETGTVTFGKQEIMETTGLPYWTYANSVFGGATLPSEVYLPPVFPRIPEGCFSGIQGVETFTIASNGDMIVEAGAFQSSRVKKFVFQGAVKYLSYSMFRDSSLGEIVLPECDYIRSECFMNCPNLKSVTWPETPCEVDYGFFQDSGIENITLPDWLESVPRKWFYQCNKLQNVNFGTSLKSIEEEAFAYSTVQFNSSTPFPEGLESIGPRGFLKCSNLQAITFPSTLKEIGKHAFAQCTSLTLPNFEQAASLEKINEAAFADCQSIESVHFPPSLKSVGDSQDTYKHINIESTYYNDMRGVFQRCLNLKEVTLNPGVTLEAYCFAATGLEEVTLRQDVTYRQGVYQGCQGLTGVTIPGWMKSMPMELFASCRNVRSLLIESGVEEIGDLAFSDFRNDHALVTIFPTTLKTIGKVAFGATNVFAAPDMETYTEMLGQEFPTPVFYLPPRWRKLTTSLSTSPCAWRVSRCRNP